MPTVIYRRRRLSAMRAEYQANIDREQLPELGKELQIQVMREWFFAHYEDPVERTPYQSSEGGYLWIWGGPYGADEVLQDEFSGLVSYEAIGELARELSHICYEWAPKVSEDDYEDSYLDDIALIQDCHAKFLSAILDIEELLNLSLDQTSQSLLNRLLYANVISSLETFLSDTFVNVISRNKNLLRRFIESNADFRYEKIQLSDVFKEYENLEKRVMKYLADMVWHNLLKAMAIYKSTLSIEFPKNRGFVLGAINIRHDLVHRNGYTKDGAPIDISVAQIQELISEVKVLASNVNEKINLVERPGVLDK